MRKNLTATGIRSPFRPSRSESLHNCANPAHTNHPVVLVFKQPVITYQISRCHCLKASPLCKPQNRLAVPFAIFFLVICFRKRSNIMKVITNIYCLRRAPLKTTCCLGKGTGRAGTEQLAKSQLENCKRFMPRKLQTLALLTLNIPRGVL